MTVFGIVGTIGAGKTLFMTACMVMEYEGGTSIYSNYKVKGVESNSLNGINDLQSIPREGHKAIFMDELWLSADSRNSGNDLVKFMAKSVLQSRKIKSDVYYTTQHLGQVEKRIRDITSIIYLPQIKAYGPDGKPLLCKVACCKEDMFGEMYVYRSFFMPLIYNDTYICDLYDTHEIIDGMEDDITPQIDIKELIEKYKDSGLDKKKIVASLIVEDGLAPGYARQVAEYMS